MNLAPILPLVTVGLSVLLAFPLRSDAQQRKAAVDVDIDAMTGETQFSAPCGVDHMNLIWAIPVEFWKVVFAQDPSMAESQRAEIIGALQEFVIFGVVQADITEAGAFDFYSEAEVSAAMTMAFTDGDGNARAIEKSESVPDDAQLLLSSMKPVLTAAMGPLGQNFHFIVVKDKDGISDSNSEAGRAWNPYAFGELTVNLKNRAGAALSAKLEGPVDALFVPRKCPNGKNAHITWKFCPWTGAELD